MRISSISIITEETGKTPIEAAILLKPFSNRSNPNDNFIAIGENIPFEGIYKILDKKTLKKYIDAYLEKGAGLKFDVEIIDALGRKVDVNKYIFVGFFPLPNDKYVIVKKIQGIYKEDVNMLMKTVDLFKKAVRDQEKRLK